ncbi:hypothetical protein [Enterovirga sp. CN4-39]|uniref:hypothetical protein n=1 Tax=Enterovirga sp. CN4-39 TaxID=3400910 RepID=UPI003C0D71E1
MRIIGLGSSMRLAAGGALLLGGVTAAQAGFFERLFGIESDPQPQQYYYQPAPALNRYQGIDADEPLGFTVRKKAKPRSVRREHRETKKTAQVPIDPVKNPEWYLQDPTLRRGDIVVLKDEVLVFRGGRMPYSRQNFASLAQSDLPKAERERLSHMAGLKPVTPPRTTVASASD